jgi:hypothetical protein
MLTANALPVQVNAVVRLHMASMILLNIEQMKSTLARGLGVRGGETNLEISFIGMSDEDAALRRAIPKTETLDIGLRV